MVHTSHPPHLLHFSPDLFARPIKSPEEEYSSNLIWLGVDKFTKNSGMRLRNVCVITYKVADGRKKLH